MTENFISSEQSSDDDENEIQAISEGELCKIMVIKFRKQFE